MSASGNYPFDDAKLPTETGYSMMAPSSRRLHDEPTSRGVPNSSPTSAASHSSVVQPHATVTIPPTVPVPSAPLRVWEPGYQSPFSQSSQNPDYPNMLSPLLNFPTLSPAMETPVLQQTQGTPQRRSSQQRKRKPTTKEIVLSDGDASAMVDLGLSPFMIGQDPIANQNRFVRNENIFARKLLSLRNAQTDADHRHSKTEQDIYTRLEQQRASLDKLLDRSGVATLGSLDTIVHSVRVDPDFVILQKGHEDTTARLEALLRQVEEFKQSTQRALTDLFQRIDQLVRDGGYLTDSYVTQASSSTSTTSLSPLILSAGSSGLKRKWDSSADSILESPSTMPPPTPDFGSYRLPRTN